MGADCGRPLVGAAALIGRASLGPIELTGWTRPPCDDIGRCDDVRAEPGLIGGGLARVNSRLELQSNVLFLTPLCGSRTP